MFYTSVKQIGSYVYERGYDNEGVPFQDKVAFRPTFYISSNKESNWKTLDGKNVAAINPGSMYECREWLEKYKDVDGISVYGHETAIYQYLSEKYPEEIEDFNINKIRLYTLDIETAAELGGFPEPDIAQEEILLITIQDYSTKKIYTWGSRPFSEVMDNYVYQECANEVDLLNKFLTFWESNYPDVVTSWNGSGFDIPYIINRIKRVLGTADAKRLSPWKFIRDRQVQKNNRTETQYEIYGVSLLDYMELYKKYSFKNPENYRLDTIAYNELGQNKLDHSQYETFKDFYTYGWDTYVKYNKIDVELVDRLEEKLQLINMAIDLAYQSRSNYEDVFYQVRMWDNIIFNYLNKKKIAIPLKKQSNKSEKFAGAYVKEPIPGLYGWTVTLDLTSLYPHIMMQHNVSPETLIDQPFPSISVDKIVKKQVDTSIYPEYSICPNGSMYSKERQGFIPAILEDMYEKRKQYKNLQIAAEKEYEKSKDNSLRYKISNYKVKQLSLKVCLNSGYGALGSPYFRFYELRNAEAITSSGQLALKWIENKLNIYFNKLLKTEKVDYCIYGDTDSVMLNVDPLVNKIFEGKDASKEKIVNFINTIFSTKIQEYINESYTELANYLHAYKNKLHMKREKIADKFLITGKKHYIINVWDNEGVRYSEPKISVTGIEAVKSSTPAFCRDKLNAAFKVLMNYTEEDMIKFVEESKKEFFKLDPEEVAFPKGVSDVTKFSSTTSLYKKGTPIHVRGSILYNNSLKKHGLENKYNFISNGEKIKYCYLKMPNPIMENVIGFIQTLPKEFGLHAYVDYETQFDKTFVQPLKAILDIIGWKTEETITLDQFFI
jgi:DNA polymerase elongation subunit (family B)